MKKFSVDLLASVGSSYNKTRTTTSGRISQKTINSKQVLGAPLTKFIDVFTDTLGTLIPGHMFLSANNRLYVLLSAPVSSALNQMACYDFDLDTGAYTYRGKIAFAIASPVTLTIRGFKIDDSNLSNIKVFLGLSTTVLITGGLLVINKLDINDFVPVGFPTIYTALSSDVKGCYMYQSPQELGGLNLMTAVAGVSMPNQSVDANINTKVYVHNGVAATHQYYAFDIATAPTMAAPQVVTSSTTNGSPTFTMTGHGYQANQPLVITANAPTGFVLTGVATIQTIYYVRAANLTANTFELSATSGGVAINATSVTAGVEFRHALGISTNAFRGKTANLPALVGTLLIINSEDAANPSHTANSGFDCVFFTTTTAMYLGRYADLFSSQAGVLTSGNNTITGLTTAGLNIGQTVFGTGIPTGTVISSVGVSSITISNNATASGSQTLIFGAILWANLVNANVIGSGLDYTLPLPLQATFSSACDVTIFNTTGLFSIIKKFINNTILGNIGTYSTVYLETLNRVAEQYAAVALFGMEQRNGWLLASCTTAPQRGIIVLDLRSDYQFDFSYVITKVMPTRNAKLRSVETSEELFDSTASSVFFYRTAATESDSLFDTAAGGWVEISTAADLSSLPLDNFSQFKIAASLISTYDTSSVAATVPPQYSDFCFSLERNTEVSDNWDYSYEHSAIDIPTRVAFQLRETYTSGSVPKLVYRAYDGSGALLVTHNTVDNDEFFEYSIDDGDTWVPLGTIPNTVGSVIRYTYATPPGVDIRVSVRES